jgi:hypothetical protein
VRAKAASKLVKPATLQEQLVRAKAVSKFSSQYFLMVLAAGKFTDDNFTKGLWPPVNSSFLLLIGGFGHILRAFGRQ